MPAPTLHPPPLTPPHAEPSCCLRFWAGGQKGEEALGAPGGRDQGKARGGGLLGRGVQSLLKKLRDWSEPEGGWAVFPFPGKKKEKQPFPWELKIDRKSVV